ncbi:MAG: hypothetical protein AB1679_00075 [Actinomycetota bacterium]
MTRAIPKSRWWLSVAVATTLVVAAAACSDSSSREDGDVSPETQPTQPATTVTTAAKPTVESEVLAAYRAFWDAYLAAADPMNPEDPRLAERATGGELETVQKAFLARRSAGEVIRGTLDLAPRVASVRPDGAAATVTDCYADHTGVYDAATGARKDSESGVRHLVTVEMVLQGTWKVSSVTLERDGCTPAA